MAIDSDKNRGTQEGVLELNEYSPEGIQKTRDDVSDNVQKEDDVITYDPELSEISINLTELTTPQDMTLKKLEENMPEILQLFHRCEEKGSEDSMRLKKYYCSRIQHIILNSVRYEDSRKDIFEFIHVYEEKMSDRFRMYERDMIVNLIQISHLVEWDSVGIQVENDENFWFSFYDGEEKIPLKKDIVKTINYPKDEINALDLTDAKTLAELREVEY